MKVLFYTLGCRVNQFETAAMEAELKARGHEIVASGAEVVVVNSCAVTAESARKSRQAARRLLKQNPGALLAVCGCWPQAEPGEAGESGAALISGSGDRMKFVEQLENLCRDKASGSETVSVIDNPMKRREFETLAPAKLEGRTRAYLKIQDGCVNFCAYCVIPYLRGPVRSLCFDDAVNQAVQMYEAGIKEITLTGIELASYEYGLAELVRAIGGAAPNLRIRLGSLEPRIITEDFCGILSDAKGFCPHIHLSLQSGCDDTLKRMGRKYGIERFYRSVELLRSSFDNCGITADLITGFPGETDLEFESTLGFLRKCAFSHVHVFPYSERRGTKAASMPDQVPKAVRLQRAAAAIAEAEITERSFLLAQVGRTAEVLFESKEGHTPNYCSVIPPGKGLEGKTVKARITGVNIGNLSLTAII